METWDPANIILDKNSNKHFSMAVVASRKSGKSTLLKYLIENYLKTYEQIVVISNSINSGFYDFVPNCVKISSYDEDILTGLLELQKNDTTNRNILIVFDDCVSKKMKYSNAMLQFFARGRHSRISIIFSSQSPTLIDSDWRENLDYLIMLKQNTAAKRNHLIENFLLGFEEFEGTKSAEIKKYTKILKETCEDYGCLVVDLVDDKMCKFKVNI